jgi:beta-lactamase superfamily II metal-dependent hydrolase
VSLTFHFLNVDHGSSTIVELQTAAGKLFGLIDINGKRNTTPRAMDKLRDLGAERLAFLAITHPHADHFTGSSQILTTYGDKIDRCYLFPIMEALRNQKRRKSLYETLLKARERLDGASSLRTATEELLLLIKWVDEHQSITEFCSGDRQQLAVPGFEVVELHSILPPNIVKGSYLAMIDAEDVSVVESFVANDISLALEFSFAGRTVIIGGDGTEKNWSRRRTQFERHRKGPTVADAVCLPHHGSETDCTVDVLSQLFPRVEGSNRVAVSSGDGRRHPSPKVIDWLHKNAVQPYCTNLIPMCGANAARLEHLAGLDPEYDRWIQEVSIGSHFTQVCQGDITIRIADDGGLTTASETNNFCPFRTDFGAMFS